MEWAVVGSALPHLVIDYGEYASNAGQIQEECHTAGQELQRDQLAEALQDTRMSKPMAAARLAVELGEAWRLDAQCPVDVQQC